MLQNIYILDICDYGALGDGETPNYDAFSAADDAAARLKLLVPEGQFYIEQGLTLRSKLLFRDTVQLPVSRRLCSSIISTSPPILMRLAKNSLPLKSLSSPFKQRRS